MRSSLYTRYQDPSFDRKFQGYLDSIVMLMRSRLGNNLISVVLSGGYGRGEGSILFRGDVAFPVNDIDLVLVTRVPIDRNLLKQLRLDAAKIVKPDTQYLHGRYTQIDFHVDILPLTERDLPKLGPSQLNYDLKYGSMVIYGKQVLSQIPAFKSEEIPITDGVVLLCNRCFSLAEVFSLDLLTMDGDVNQAEWVYYFAIKGIVDSAAALLILAGKYTPFHEKRIQILESLDTGDVASFLKAYPDILPVFQQYTSRKFIIRENELKNPLRHWCLSKKILLQTLDYYLFKMSSIPHTTGWPEKIQRFITSQHRDKLRDKFTAVLHKKPIIHALRMCLSSLKFIGKIILHPTDLRRMAGCGRNVTDIWVLYAMAPLLLDALDIGIKDRHYTASVNIENLLQIQRYIGIGRANWPSDFGKADRKNNSLSTWIELRDFLVGVWKGFYEG